MAFNLTRMTAYALISALEEDFRSLIKNHLNETKDNILLNPELEFRAKSRIEKDIGILEGVEKEDLIDYFDLGDTYQTVNSNAVQFPGHITQQIKKHTKKFDSLIPIRNRVMHIRPLNIDDLPTILVVCESLSLADEVTWSNVSITLDKLQENPSFVLSLEFKVLESETRVSHNLPLPDFDETGLIGRDQIVLKVKELCLGGFPVISIVGEGGIGKTALALKVAYELLEEERCPFDAIVWVTSKTTQITVNEIKDIKGAISDSLGTIQGISDQITGTSKAFDLQEITEYLATFKIALFIDNLETILDDNIRRFVESLPQGSKIVITSRIGLGAYEYPIKLKGIDESFASQLLRTLAKLRGVSSLAKLDEAVLRSYVNRMHCNPSYIKWFVSSIQTGLTPEIVLQNSNLFLEFCMSNVYEYLSKDARLLTAALQCAPGLKDIPELAYLTEFDALKVQKAIQELMATNMLSEASKTKGASVKTTYQISELSRAYLGKHHKPTQGFQKAIREKRNKLNSLYELQMSQRENNKYSIRSIKFRDKSDRVVARMLQESLKNINLGQHDKAYETLEEARRLAPDYSEVARVLAYFYQKSGSFNDARDQYELAIVLDENSPQLNYWFGKFLLQEEENADDAVIQFELAHSKDPEAAEVCLSLARGYMFQHKFKESREILETLKCKIEEAEEHNQKVYLDTDIQIYYRTGDDLTAAGDYITAIEKFKEMKGAFLKVPDKFRDSFLRKKLTKSSVSLNKIIKSGSAAVADALALKQWVEVESSL
ncbi:tetratricopeptide repeat protein [Pseudomonas fragi]|uniref:tetratricopeptide repeat protein n=1 Tax=Pseudomonas fragi TaxID=296 RepID=UPI00030BE619|nr:NB-ARC domain-containing protein [Pseudomonas fragi]MDE4514936.1 ATP-binding protein [Pseudomonas fragi]QPC36485.1 ATP-binding protein [Pseudomonas fragi]SDU40416.1 NB-ARC domain-containing protein [Pseudomonas fragi]